MEHGVKLIALALSVVLLYSAGGMAQTSSPTLVDQNLEVRTVVAGLVTPATIAFLGPNDILVLEKNTGLVRRVINGVVQTTPALDLSVNFNSERGLLGIALHPNFPAVPDVYLFWTCRSVTPQDSDPFRPEEQECSDAAMTGLPDSGDVLQVPLLGNRVDRFGWNGTTLTYEQNLIKLLAFQNDGAPEPAGQNDSNQPARGNHDGGVIAFGPDRKLYIIFGDVGRRSQLQNLPSGPTPTGTGPTVADDQFGGPQPDNAHFTGVIIRLNDDGSTPSDNPFFAAGQAISGQVGANIQKIFAYGIRNSFGMAFDPFSGNLWDQENGEDAFDEINLVERGMNSGWIQIIGPAARIAQYRQIETTALHHEDFPNLQQFRWASQNIATSEQQAKSRLFTLPGSKYSDPEFSWKFVVPPAAIGFMSGRGLGPQYEGDLFVGAALPESHPGGGGQLLRFNLTGNRQKIGVEDPRLEDRVADNLDFHDLTESESLLFGRNFGVVTAIETGPNGNLFLVSLDKGAIFEIRRRR